MIVVGLVGKIAAGKSTVARRLAARGARVIDADAVAHDVLDDPGPRQAIVARFGGDVLDDAGRVRRGVLAGRVFGPTPAHAAALADLEAIVHPPVRRRIEGEIDRLRREAGGGPRPVVVLDVPLLLQAGWAGMCDRLILVECDEAERERRMAARSWTAAEREAREAAWGRRYPADGLPPGKTTTVDTSRNLAYTLEQVDAFWSSLGTGHSPNR
jgi:dephospho-CoA kinase